MPRAAVSPAMREISRQLGVVVPGGADPTPKIVTACLAKVRAWCEQLGPVSSFDDLIAIAAAKLKVHFEVLKSDEDLRATERRHLEMRETGFLNLAKEFDEYTDAVVIRLQQAPSWSDRQYVAVIDNGVNPTSNGPFTSTSPYYLADNGYPSFNLAKAQQLVSEVKASGAPIDRKSVV